MAEIKQFRRKDNYESSENTDLNTNLKQNINVNVKNSRNFRKDILLIILHVLVIIFLITLIITLFIIISEKTFSNKTCEQEYQKCHERIKDLELQMSNVMLRLKYDEQNSNSIQHIQSVDYSESKSESSTYNSADLSETKKDCDNFNSTSELNDLTTPSASVQSLDHQNNELKNNISKTLNIYPMSPIRLNENNLPEIEKLLRQKRALSKTQNHTITEDGRNDNNTASVQRISRMIKGRRNRRKGGKGKIRQKKKKEGQGRGRRERNRGRLGPKVVTFIGAIPEQTFRDTVYVGPWIKSDKSNTILPSSYRFTKFYLREEDYAIEVNMGGLYMISVQIFYFGNLVNYSYWMLLKSEGSSTKQKLITCATGSASEVSCYTGVTTYLQTGDRLTILQQEKNRFVNLREGYSQIQLVLLANDKDED